MLKGRHIDIMGIINLTDDSFYAESRCVDQEAVLERAGQMIAEGATILDFGASSSRPGSEPVGPDEEWRRLEPALSAVRNRWPEVEISIDTTWSSVVSRAYELIGEIWVNDISSGQDDPQMLPLVGKLGLKYIAMHKRGDARTMQSMTDYDDVVEDVIGFFKEFAVKAQECGVRNWILDPGFGFAKTVSQNYIMMRDLRRFRLPYPSVGIPKILVGVSRKSMIYKALDITPEESLPQTQVLHLKALQEGTDILRVHDVAEAKRTVEVYWRLC